MHKPSLCQPSWFSRPVHSLPCQRNSQAVTEQNSALYLTLLPVPSLSPCSGDSRKNSSPRVHPTIQARGSNGCSHTALSRSRCPNPCPLPQGPSGSRGQTRGETGTHCLLFTFLRILYKGSKNPIHTLLRKILK